MRPIWRFRLRRTFFGLSAEYMQQVYEQFFFVKQLQDEKKAVEEASKGKGKSQELTAFNQPRRAKGPRQT